MAAGDPQIWRPVADPDLVLHYNPLGPLDDVLEANSSRLEEVTHARTHNNEFKTTINQRSNQHQHLVATLSQ